MLIKIPTAQTNKIQNIILSETFDETGKFVPTVLTAALCSLVEKKKILWQGEKQEYLTYYLEHFTPEVQVYIKITMK